MGIEMRREDELKKMEEEWEIEKKRREDELRRRTEELERQIEIDKQEWELRKQELAAETEKKRQEWEQEERELRKEERQQELRLGKQELAQREGTSKRQDEGKLQQVLDKAREAVGPEEREGQEVKGRRRGLDVHEREIDIQKTTQPEESRRKIGVIEITLNLDALKYPNIPMGDDPSDLNPFFKDMERVFNDNRTPECLKGLVMRPYLYAEARALLLDVTSARDYEAIKQRILNEYNVPRRSCLEKQNGKFVVDKVASNAVSCNIAKRGKTPDPSEALPTLDVDDSLGSVNVLNDSHQTEENRVELEPNEAEKGGSKGAIDEKVDSADAALETRQISETPNCGRNEEDVNDSSSSEQATGQEVRKVGGGAKECENIGDVDNSSKELVIKEAQDSSPQEPTIGLKEVHRYHEVYYQNQNPSKFLKVRGKVKTCERNAGDHDYGPLQLENKAMRSAQKELINILSVSTVPRLLMHRHPMLHLLSIFCV